MQALRQALKKIILGFFIFINVFIVVVDSVPDHSIVVKKILKIFSPYQDFLGLNQGWTMFAPNPSAINSYLDAEVSFSDGSKTIWSMPRPSQFSGVMGTIIAGRYRKFAQDGLDEDAEKEVWHDVSQYVIRDLASTESVHHREVESIRFIQHWNRVPTLDKTFIPHGQEVGNYKELSLFVYQNGEKVRYEASNNK